MIPLNAKPCATCGLPPTIDTAGTHQKVACQFVQCEPYLDIPWFPTLAEAAAFWNDKAFDAKARELTQAYRPPRTSPIFETRKYRLDPIGFTVVCNRGYRRNFRIPIEIRHSAAVVINAMDFLQNGAPPGKRLPSGLWAEAINAFCEVLFAAHNQVKNDCEDQFHAKPTTPIPPTDEQTPRPAP